VTQTSRTLPGRGDVARGRGDTSITVIGPPRGWPGLGLAEFWRYREICFVLVKRNLMVRYRQTVVGAGWSILQPLALMAVFSVFFGLLARLPTNGLPFPVFYFLGLLPWQMTSKIMTEGTHSVVANSALVTRVYFPRAYFPTSVALSSFIDLLLATTALVVLLAISGIVPGATVVVAPYFIAVAWMAGLGVAFWLSALNVTYRDVSQMLPFLTQMWMFGSPIIYPSALIPEPFHTWYFLNPMALVVEGMRWAIAGTPVPVPVAWVLGTASAVFLLVSGYVFFRRREATFADRV
jgi:lipopolysaccharide transport system permease protein